MSAKLKGKVIKRHMVKTYSFWQINNRFLVIAGDQENVLADYKKMLPPIKEGYLAYAYLDEVIRLAFIGHCDPESDEYEFFDCDKYPVIPAVDVPNLLVRLVKPTAVLNEHPLVKRALRIQEKNVLALSALTLRGLDPFRDPERPFVFTAFRVTDEKKAEAAVGRLTEARADHKDKEADEETAEAIAAIGADMDDFIEKICLRDLRPAAHNTWKATLWQDLPEEGKKKGDDIVVVLRETDYDDQQLLIPFTDIKAEIPTDTIEVGSLKSSRLPWRKAYELKCTSCPFHETYYLGRNGEDHDLFREIMEDLRQGRLDPAFYIDLVQDDDAQLDFSRELYRCRTCGDINVTRRLRIVTPETSLSETYNCPSCGERMSHVKRVHIASLNCPECQAPLELVSEKLWSEQEES